MQTVISLKWLNGISDFTSTFIISDKINLKTQIYFYGFFASEV